MKFYYTNKDKTLAPSSTIRVTGAVAAEFIVSASLVLVGFLLTIPLVAKVIDVRQKSEMAARYATWERTVWFQSAPGYFPNQNLEKSNVEIENEIAHRIFSTKDQIIDSRVQRESADNVELEPFLNFQNRTTGDQETLLQPNGQKIATLSQFDAEPPEIFGTSVEVGLTALTALSLFTSSPPINENGYYTGEISVPIKEFAWIEEFQGITPTFVARGAILSDAWNTNDELAEERAFSLSFQSALNQSGALTAIKTTQNVVGVIFEDLNTTNLQLFQTDIDAVPEVRVTDAE